MRLLRIKIHVSIFFNAGVLVLGCLRYAILSGVRKEFREGAKKWSHAMKQLLETFKVNELIDREKFFSLTYYAILQN